MKLRPLGDGVLVRVAKADDKSKGGIIIPEANKERPRRGVVLAVGPGRWADGAVALAVGARYQVEVSPGNEVLLGAFVGIQVGEEEDLLLLKESEILAVIEPKEVIDPVLRGHGPGTIPEGAFADPGPPPSK